MNFHLIDLLLDFAFLFFHTEKQIFHLLTFNLKLLIIFLNIFAFFLKISLISL